MTRIIGAVLAVLLGIAVMLTGCATHGDPNLIIAERDETGGTFIKFPNNPNISPRRESELKEQIREQLAGKQGTVRIELDLKQEIKL